MFVQSGIDWNYSDEDIACKPIVYYFKKSNIQTDLQEYETKLQRTPHQNLN